MIHHQPSSLHLLMQKTCSKCGVEFGCQNEIPGCWCEKISLDEEALAKLKLEYDNCLCPVCLKSFERPSATAGHSPAAKF